MAKNITTQLAKKPGTIFLIDSAGALLTAFFLFVVVKNFNDYFGVPGTVLIYLSAIAVCFCIYSTACFFFLTGNRAPFIRGIAIANLLYCILTTGVLIMYYPLLTLPGITYFLAEIVLICGLVYIELNVASAIGNNGASSID